MGFYINSTTKEQNSAAIFPPIVSQESNGTWIFEFVKGSNSEATLVRIVVIGFEMDNSITGWTQYFDSIGSSSYDVDQIPNNWNDPSAPYTGNYDCVNVDISEINGLNLSFNFVAPSSESALGEIQIYFATDSERFQTFHLYDSYNVAFQS